jgi:xanthine/uracil permease
MNKEIPAGTDATLFAAVFNENWQNARHIKSERISFMNAYSLISAGVLTLLQSAQATDLIRIALLLFMSLFSLIGLLTSLRLKGELEECLAKIEAMSVQARVNDFVALGQLEGRSSRYPRFRWIFPIFYAMTTAGFITLIVYRLVTGEAMR